MYMRLNCHRRRASLALLLVLVFRIHNEEDDINYAVSPKASAKMYKRQIPYISYNHVQLQYSTNG